MPAPRSARRLLVSLLLTAHGVQAGPDASVVASPAEPAHERRCAFEGIRRGDRPACQGVERTVLGRPFCVHAPLGSRPRLPVVLLLHGYSSNGESQSRYLDLDSQVDRRGFILVKPNGTMNAHGSRFWNAGRRFSVGGPDDVGYLAAVIDDVVTTFDADPARVYALGHSNGAFMAHRLACERSNRIAAIVTIAGSVVPGSCRPEQPVSVLTVHGTKDRLIRYEGDTLLGASYASADVTLDFWARADGCQKTRRPGPSLRLVCDAQEATVAMYAGCPPGITVEHWRLDGVGHVPNFALPAWPAAVLDFLWAHPKPAASKPLR